MNTTSDDILHSNTFAKALFIYMIECVFNGALHEREGAYNLLTLKCHKTSPSDDLVPQLITGGHGNSISSRVITPSMIYYYIIVMQRLNDSNPLLDNAWQIFLVLRTNTYMFGQQMDKTPH